MSNTIGSLVVDLVANTAQFTNELQKMNKQVKDVTESIKSTLEGIGFLVVIDQIKDAITEATRFGDEISKSAAKTGAGTQALTELAFAAKQVGIDLPSLTQSIDKMEKSISNAETGIGTSKTAFDALGISLGQLKNLSPDKQFEEIADQINKLPTPTDKARAAMEIFGRAGAELLPLFEQGAAGIELARQKAVAFGASFDEDQIKRLKDANDSINDMKASFTALATTLTAAVSPGLKSFFDSINDISTGNKLGIVGREVKDLQERIAAADQLAPNSYESKALQKQLNDAQQVIAGLNLAKKIKDDLSSTFTDNNGVQPGAAPGFLPDIKEITVNPNLKTRIDGMKKFYQDLDDATETGYEKLITDTSKLQAKLDLLVADGQISLADSFNRARDKDDTQALSSFFTTNAAEIEAAFKDMEISGKVHFAAISADAKVASENMSAEFRQNAQIAVSVGNAITNTFQQAFDNIGKGGLKGLVIDFINAFRKILDQALALDLAKALGITEAFKNQGSDSALGSLFSGLSSLFGGGGSAGNDASTAATIGFASGGSFQVGGNGGTDSQLVQFRASPNERVTVSTPGQQSSGGSVIMQNTYNIGSGVSRADVIQACNQSSRATVAHVSKLIKGGAFA